MVEFSEYVSIAYEVADEKGIQLTGPGTAQANQQFMSQLGEAYNANDHSEASRSAAYDFLEANVGPP
jgi:hypothetical protein